MPFFPASARRFLVSCSAATVVLLAAAGCRSAQSAYEFRPESMVAATAPARPLPAATPAPTATAAAPLLLVRPLVTQPVRRPTRRAALAAPLRLARQLTPVGRPAYAVVRPARRGAGATNGAQATAEVGLGTTVLGVLGLIVGPISLIGLLIWGGPVWAALLGLSALAVLVAYIDPFR